MAIFKGKGLVWNPVKENILCNFNNGDYETTDEQEKAILIKLGFEYDDLDEIPIVEEETEEEIRAKAKELGITNWHNKKIENIEKEISELEV